MRLSKNLAIFCFFILSCCILSPMSKVLAVNPVGPNDTFNQALSTVTYGNWTYSDYRNSGDCFGLAGGNDGGYILVGCRMNPITLFDAWLVKVDSTGVEQWNQSYGALGRVSYNQLFRWRICIHWLYNANRNRKR
jgi:hypothetical protein